MKTLADLKVGDEVWTIQRGLARITAINDNCTFGIDVDNYSYQLDGKYFDSDIFNMIFYLFIIIFHFIHLLVITSHFIIHYLFKFDHDSPPEHQILVVIYHHLVMLLNSIFFLVL